MQFNTLKQGKLQKSADFNIFDCEPKQIKKFQGKAFLFDNSLLCTKTKTNEEFHYYSHIERSDIVVVTFFSEYITLILNNDCEIRLYGETKVMQEWNDLLNPQKETSKTEI